MLSKPDPSRASRELPVEGAQLVRLLDGTLIYAWPASKVCYRPWYRDNPNGGDPILTHIEKRLWTRWERVVNRFWPMRVFFWKLRERFGTPAGI